jgi:hypothetical protein
MKIGSHRAFGLVRRAAFGFATLTSLVRPAYADDDSWGMAPERPSAATSEGAPPPAAPPTQTTSTEAPSTAAPEASAPGAPSAAPGAFQSETSTVVADAALVPVIYLDRAVVRFSAPETGGTLSPHFIFERELAFEARLEALADRTYVPDADRPYGRHHLQAALERHIAETLLASLRIDPEPAAERIDMQIRAARVLLTEQVGGALALQDAARQEGIGDLELRKLLRRRARASLYLDQMVAPMLEPSEAELRKLHRTAQTPFRGQPYREISPRLRRWYIGTRLGAAALAYYQNARARLSLEFLPRALPSR